MRNIGNLLSGVKQHLSQKICLVSVAGLLAGSAAASEPIRGPATHDDACKLLAQIYHVECGHDPFQTREPSLRPFLDRTGAGQGFGYIVAIPAGISLRGDLGQEHDRLALLLPDGTVIPDRIIQIKSLHGALLDLNGSGLTEEDKKKFRGLLFKKDDKICYVGFVANINQPYAYCVAEERFDAASVMVNEGSDRSAAFDRSALLALDVSELITGDGISLALRHPALGNMSAIVAADGNTRRVEFKRATYASPNDIVSLQIRAPGTYQLELSFGNITEQYEVDLSDSDVTIRGDKISTLRFSSLKWHRTQKYSGTQLSIYCTRNQENAEDICRSLSEVARKFGAAISENSNGYYTHMGPNAWASVVSKYDIANPGDVQKAKDAILAAAPETKAWPQRTFVEWVGQGGTGVCSHAGCSPLSETIYDKATDQDYSDATAYYLP